MISLAVHIMNLYPVMSNPVPEIVEQRKAHGKVVALVVDNELEVLVAAVVEIGVELLDSFGSKFYVEPQYQNPDIYHMSQHTI